MPEYEILMAQKREIEQKLKALKHTGYTRSGCAKIDVERYPTNLPDRWYLAIDVKDVRPDSKKTCPCRTIVNGASRTEIVYAIPEIVKDLQDLYNKSQQEQQ